MVKISTILSLVGGSLLTISEILPYVSKVKSNGIVQFIVDIFSKNDKDDDDKDLQSKTIKLEKKYTHVRIEHKNPSILDYIFNRNGKNGPEPDSRVFKIPEKYNQIDIYFPKEKKV
jgi:hypothetical protein